MKPAGPPPHSDVRLEVRDGEAWRIIFPVRWRGRHAMHGVAGLAAGALLVTMSGGGAFEALAHPSWGARVFMLGWLVPLGFIGVLLIWLGAKTFARLWQWVIVESDGVTVRQRTRAPWGESVVFELPLTRAESFRPPPARDDPNFADIAVRRAYRGPLELRYRSKTGKETLSYPFLQGASYDELVWLVSALNPILARQRGGKAS